MDRKVQQAINKLTKKRRWWNGKRNDFVKDNKNYRYFDLETKKYMTITKEEMNVAAVELPKECSRALLDMKEKKRCAYPHEQHVLLKLCSLSLSLWKGDPQGKIPYVHIEEYQAQFYLNFVKCFVTEGKSRFNPERANWCRYVKWLRLDTVAYFAKLYQKQKILIDAATIEIDELLKMESGNEEREFWDEFTDALHLQKVDEDNHKSEIEKAKARQAERMKAKNK